MSIAQNKPAEDKRKRWLIGALCLIAVVVSALSIVHQLPKAPKAAATAPGGYPGGGGGFGGRQMPGTRGQITAITASAITIQGRGGAAQTFALTPATKITVDQNSVAATDLKPGQRARVVSADSKTATEVHIRTRPFGGRGGGYPGGRGGGYPGGPPAAARPPGPAGG